MASYSFSTSWHGFTYTVAVSATANSAGNYSSVSCSHYLSASGGWRLAISGRTITCNVSGGVGTVGTPGFDITGTTVSLGTTYHTVYHNSNGTGSFSLSSSMPVNASISGYGTCGTLTVTGSGALDTIHRSPSTISTSGSGTIGAAVKINISRQSSSFTHTLTYSFSDLTGTIATKTTGASYNWTIPTGFYAKIPNAKSGTCTLTCETFNGSTSLGKRTTTLTVNIDEAKSKPTLNPTVKDVNSKSVGVTKNDQTLIKFLSNAQVTANAAGTNSATIKSYRISCGSKALTTATGTFDAVETGSFVFTVTDSRGLTASKTITLTVIDYLNLTCNFIGEKPNINGDFSFTIEGNYFNKAFNSNQNTLAIAYRYKAGSGSYGSWTTVTPSITDDYYSVSVDLSGLDSKKEYYFQARAIDLVSTVYSDETLVKYIPVFDWGKNDFAFNVPISINGRGYGESRILWEGAYYMTADQTITLAEAISAQPNGVVLVFSLYRDGAAAEASINTFFVSKKQVELFPEVGHTFIMGINAGFSSIGAKYLYFTDTTIYGHEGNNSVSTNSGISFKNNNYVLRYVIGV